MNLKEKHAIAAMVAMLIICLALTAYSENAAWDCPECGKIGNVGNYCGKCAHPAPWLEAASSDASESITIGDIIRFGHYEQDGDLSNGPETIEWIVLDYNEQEQKALLLSKYGLDSKLYNKKVSRITWENCELRTWLNKEFYNAAFALEEQNAILMTTVDNSHGQGYSQWLNPGGTTDGGNNTQDKVFLLSYAEAKRYLGVKDDEKNDYDSALLSMFAPVTLTAYARQHGATAYERTTATGKEATGWWWLRSPGFYQHNAFVVLDNGKLEYYIVYNDGGCVRPAIWVNLKSNAF